jgi:hypothetical protein
MPSPSSIPASLHESIVSRWIAGASPTAIVEWIEETNPGREVPVQTSRSSIQRLLRTLAAGNTASVRLQVIQRVAMNASATLDQLEDLGNGYQEAIRDARQVSTSVDARQLTARLSAMAKAEASLFRHLKFAGVTGAAADRLLRQQAPVMEEIRERLQEENQREAQGLAPEGEPTQVPASLTPNAAKQGESKRAPPVRASGPAPVDVSPAVLRTPAPREWALRPTG